MARSTEADNGNARVHALLSTYAEVAKGTTDVDDEDTMIRDILSDLMHYCRNEGHDFPSMLLTATVNFESESDEEA